AGRGGGGGDDPGPGADWGAAAGGDRLPGRGAAALPRGWLRKARPPRRGTPGRRLSQGSGSLKVHLMGVGGAGVSSLAQVLLARGEAVSGCDLKPSETTERLAAEGAQIAVGHDPAHVVGQDLLVHSAAIRPGKPELDAARSAGVRTVSRAELLAELFAATDSVAVAGTHGKTTTTHMAGQVLAAGGLDPTVLVGDGASTRIGSGRWLVAEADERDGSLVLHRPSHAIVTNLELVHPRL